MVPIPVILNLRSGQRASWRDERRIGEALAAAGVEAKILPVAGAADIESAAARCLAENARVIAAAGGDGTISAVAARLAGTGRVLGVIPMGTLNHFAKDAGIPLGLEAAARNLRTGVIKAVDVAEVNGRVFVNNSSLGLYPTLVREREQLRRRGFRRLTASWWAGLAVLRRLPFVRVRLEVEGREIESSTPFFFAGNNDYVLEGFRLGARDCLTAGRLSVCIAHRRGRWGLAALAMRALFGHIREARDFDIYHPRELLVDSRAGKLAVSLDGEVVRLRTPLHYMSRPLDLLLLVPAAEEAGAPA